ncbi:hypothetical protein ACPA0F_09110 [Solibacillus silvestris]
MSIKLKLEGFDELIKQIEAAGGSAEGACESAMRQSAQIMDAELRNALKAANPDLNSDLASRMPAFEVNREDGVVYAKVGFKGTAYDPNNPSDYFKAIFANYGTPSRSKHGKEEARGFVAIAKKKASPKIKKAQKEVFDKILGRLKK